MNKIAALLFVFFAINVTPLQAMQYSFFSKKEAQKIRREVEHNDAFCKHKSHLQSRGYEQKSCALIWLLMLYIFLFQSQAALLPYDDGYQTNTFVETTALPHFIFTDPKAWVLPLSRQAWAETFQPLLPQHTIKDFIVGLAHCARNETDVNGTAVMNFLQQEEQYGFALESFIYYEKDNGAASLELRHLVARNNVFEDETSAKKNMTRSLNGIDTIVSKKDVLARFFFDGGTCFKDREDVCFNFIVNVNFGLKISPAVCKNVYFDYQRGSRIPILVHTEREPDEQREDL